MTISKYNYLLVLVCFWAVGCTAKGQDIDVRNTNQSIVDGRVAEPDEFPQVVQVGGCTGTIIDPLHVLTAAHCVCGLAFPVPNEVEGFPIASIEMVSPWCFSEDDCTPAQNSTNWCARYESNGSTIKGEFDNRANHGIDVAMLTLGTPIPASFLLGQGFIPVLTDYREAVANFNFESGENPALHLTVVGFGGDQFPEGGPKGIKRLVEVTHGDHAVHTNVIIVDEEGDQNAPTSDGDSGGPLFLTHDGQMMQIGVSAGRHSGGILEDNDSWFAATYDHYPGSGNGSFIRRFAEVDDDGIPQIVDNCPGRGNASQADADGDGVGDACDNCVAVEEEGFLQPPTFNPRPLCASDAECVPGTCEERPVQAVYLSVGEDCLAGQCDAASRCALRGQYTPPPEESSSADDDAGVCTIPCASDLECLGIASEELNPGSIPRCFNGECLLVLDYAECTTDPPPAQLPCSGTLAVATEHFRRTTSA